MVWQYLSQFWNNVVETTLTGATYTVQWFQQIGNAVAGAVGNLLAVPVRFFVDIMVLVFYLFSLLKDLFYILISPITYVFHFIVSFYSSAMGPSVAPELSIPATTAVSTIFSGFPYWSQFVVLVNVVIGLFFAFVLLRQLQKFK